MNGQNVLFKRLLLLGIFVLGVFILIWMAKTLSQSQQPNDNVVIDGTYEKGKAVLVEFSDFQCPACGAYYPLVKQLKADMGDKLTVVYKHFPLKNIHKNAEIAAMASEAALLQGKFIEMHDFLFEKQGEWSGSDTAQDVFTSYAQSLGLDMNRFRSDLESDAVAEKIDADYSEGVSLRVNGTPTFFINGKKIANPRGYDEFKALIEQAIGQ